MNHFTKLCCLIFLSVSGVAYAVNPCPMPNRPVLVSVSSPTFTLKLPVASGTGYSWFLQMRENTKITPVSKSYQAADKSVPGSWGCETWVFKAAPEAFTVPQYTFLTMVYARPWEEQPAKTANLKIYFEGAH